VSVTRGLAEMRSIVQVLPDAWDWKLKSLQKMSLKTTHVTLIPLVFSLVNLIIVKRSHQAIDFHIDLKVGANVLPEA